MGIRSGIKKTRAIRQSKRINKSNKKSSQRKIQEPDAQEWDKNMSTNENYKRIGLARDLNQQVHLIEKVGEPNLPLEVEYEVDINSMKALNGLRKPWESDNPKLKSILKAAVQESVISSKRKPKLNKDEEESLVSLLRKYKLDFESMRKNISLNVFQWTDIQCRNKVKNFIEKFGKDRLVKIVGDYSEEDVFGRDLEEY